MTAPPATTPAAPTRRTSATKPSPAAPTRGGRVQTAFAVLIGAAFLVWPAALNRYPILFSDTGGLLEMGFGPAMGWDKPWVYGPLLAILSLNLTLWLPLVAQGLALSYMLWLAQSLLPPPTPVRHLLLCLILALGTAAPWITATLMPDVFTPVVVLGIAVLTLGHLRRPHRIAAATILAVAIAAHLSHLILAAACIATAALLRRMIPWRPLASLAAALVFLLASNWIGHGRFGISPYGSVFALARLIGDGPARDYLARACPDAGYILCKWQEKLTADSDQFLWDPASPFWSDPAPLPVFAAQAAAIVTETVKIFPFRVLRDAVGNGVHELGLLTLGDTLVSGNLEPAVRPRLSRYLPADVPRYENSLQARNQLPASARPFIPLQLGLLGLAAAGGALILVRSIRHPTPAADFAALILIALAANAFATGALSTPHDRYQVRIAWLILVPTTLLSLTKTPSRGWRERAWIRVGPPAPDGTPETKPPASQPPRATSAPTPRNPAAMSP